MLTYAAQQHTFSTYLWARTAVTLDATECLLTRLDYVRSSHVHVKWFDGLCSTSALPGVPMAAWEHGCVVAKAVGHWWSFRHELPGSATATCAVVLTICMLYLRFRALNNQLTLACGVCACVHVISFFLLAVTMWYTIFFFPILLRPIGIDDAIHCRQYSTQLALVWILPVFVLALTTLCTQSMNEPKTRLV